ncbi:hypothetical protein [Lactobacillus helveticus]|uniref:hypothetical protein n=1 Tax=Lactobacillus helveticus TaxID=1587 RepID=UPI001D046909|nr:hypothetical protein [Lactobacillus helveticus]
MASQASILDPFCAMISANPAEIAESTSDAVSAPESIWDPCCAISVNPVEIAELKSDAASALDELPPLKNIRKIPNTIENQYRNCFLFTTEHSSKQI